MEDKRADSEFKQVTCVPVNVIGFYFFTYLLYVVNF